MDSVNFNTIYYLKPAVKNYSWGSVDKIQRIVGIKPDGQPLAEIWMGNHSNGMTNLVLKNGDIISVSDFIALAPDKVLGKACAEKFSNSLPFLFKMLTAEKPLSLQAHPDKATAVEGFARENAAGIPINQFNRNYKDSNHKKEMIFPVTEFILMHGFRSIEEIKHLFLEYIPETGRYFLDFNCDSDEDFYRKFFERFILMSEDKRLAMLKEIKNNENLLPVVERVIFMKLSLNYPDDRCIFAPLFLNCTLLNPGECMVIGDGQFHSYVEGTCFELMSASDNTLRGGLTDKYIDVKELFKVMKFRKETSNMLFYEKISSEKKFSPVGDEFYFSEIVPENNAYISEKKHNIEILFVYSGYGTVENSSGLLEIKKGESLMVPSDAGEYKIKGSADLIVYKAAVPL